MTAAFCVAMREGKASMSRILGAELSQEAGGPFSLVQLQLIIEYESLRWRALNDHWYDEWNATLKKVLDRELKKRQRHSGVRNETRP